MGFQLEYGMDFTNLIRNLVKFMQLITKFFVKSQNQSNGVHLLNVFTEFIRKKSADYWNFPADFEDLD